VARPTDEMRLFDRPDDADLITDRPVPLPLKVIELGLVFGRRTVLAINFLGRPLSDEIRTNGACIKSIF
jgi:hypothetical protein